MADVEPQRLSTKRRFVYDGVFYAELNEFLRNEMMPEHDMWAQEFKSESRGYAGVHVHRDLTCTHITIRTTRMDDVIGQDGRGVNELQGLIQQRFGFSEGQVKLAIEKVVKRGLAAEVQAENVRTRLLEGLPARRAIMGVLRNVIEEGARGCEVVVTGKLRGGRAKAMKFRQGYMIKTGHARNLYVRSATRHVMMRQGVLGVKVKIMLDRDLTGVDGPVEPLPDIVEIVDPDAPKAKPVAKSGGAGFRRERRDRDDRAPARSAAQDAQAAAAAAQAAAAAAGVPAEGAAAPAGEIGGQ